MGPEAIRHCALLAHSLRRAGVRVGIDYSNRGLKAQMKIAGRLGARHTLILGEAEWEKREAILRDMATQEQQGFALEGDAAAQAERLAALPCPILKSV